MRTSSAKAKGRRLQNAVAEAIREAFSLEPDDVRPAIMGASGEDILLSPAARKRFPYAVECKNTERLNVWDALRQADANCGEHTPLLIFSRNRSKAYVVLEFDRFLDLATTAAYSGAPGQPGKRGAAIEAATGRLS